MTPTSGAWAWFPGCEEEGAVQMALDAELLRWSARSARPCFRSYRFPGPTISLGRFQEPAVLDWEAVSREQVAVVRRPSGGRAVLHSGDLVYAVCWPLKQPLSRADAFAFLAGYLVRACHRLGIEARAVSGRHGRPSQDCFSSLSQWEIADRKGTKLAGSAQLVVDGALLQHGSFPLSTGDSNLERFLRGTRAQQQVRTRGGLGAGYQDLEQALLQVFYGDNMPLPLEQSEALLQGARSKAVHFRVVRPAFGH